MKKLIQYLLLFIVIISANAENIEPSSKKDRGIILKNNVTKKAITNQRIALVIGNSNYNGVLSKLSNPTNDASSMKILLEQQGFEVIYAENSSKKSMKKILKRFYTALKNAAVGMFYFSGHGIEVEGQNYLIPTDAKLEEKSDTEYEAISLNKIIKRMQNIGNQLNIVVLDACRNDPFSRAIGTGGLAKMEPIGMFVSYATGAGKVASDGKVGENGLFTKSLMKHMQQPLELREVFQQTRAEVYALSNHKQFPAIYDQTINGKFYFTTSTPAQRSSKRETKKSIKFPKKNSLKGVSTPEALYVPQLNINSTLEKSFSIRTLKSKMINGMTEVAFEIQNKTNAKKSLQYKVKWLDNEGFEVAESLSIWQPLFVEANDFKRVKTIAPMPTIHACKIYFK